MGLLLWGQWASVLGGWFQPQVQRVSRDHLRACLRPSDAQSRKQLWGNKHHLKSAEGEWPWTTSEPRLVWYTYGGPGAAEEPPSAAGWLLVSAHMSLDGGKMQGALKNRGPARGGHALPAIRSESALDRSHQGGAGPGGKPKFSL